MSKIILFSPVGGTDPISSTNYHDGSMLHIVRHYHPDKIILYFSKEMLAFQKSDNRYLYALNELFKFQNRVPAEIVEIERGELSEVQEFDFFYEDFRIILTGLSKELGEEDQLLINVSSGTPAMKSGLAVLQTMGEIPAKLIQVVTPERTINEHSHKDYDIETLWEIDEDNTEGAENRCREIHWPSLVQMKNEQIIREMVNAFDYNAAVAIASKIPDSRRRNYYPLLKMAQYRLEMDFAKTEKQIGLAKYNCYTVKPGKGRKLVEYALNMDIKRRRGEYADFIRSITPLIKDLFILILKDRLQIPVKDYLTKDESDWRPGTLEGTDVQKTLENDGFYISGRDKHVKSVQLLSIIRANSKDAALTTLCENLRHVEEKIRNTAAHELASVNDDIIRDTTGFTSSRIMKMIKELFSYTKIEVTENGWNSYDRMNEAVLQKMEQASI